MSRYMLINKGTNPYNGQPVTALRVNDDLVLSWNGENLVAFGRGSFASVSLDFGWQLDHDTTRDDLASAIERAGTEMFLEWANLRTAEHEGNFPRLDPADFIAWSQS